MKVKDLIRFLEDCDGEMEVVQERRNGYNKMEPRQFRVLELTDTKEKILLFDSSYMFGGFLDSKTMKRGW